MAPSKKTNQLLSITYEGIGDKKSKSKEEKQPKKRALPPLPPKQPKKSKPNPSKECLATLEESRDTMLMSVNEIISTRHRELRKLLKEDNIEKCISEATAKMNEVFYAVNIKKGIQKSYLNFANNLDSPSSSSSSEDSDSEDE